MLLQPQQRLATQGQLRLLGGRSLPLLQQQQQLRRISAQPLAPNLAPCRCAVAERLNAPESGSQPRGTGPNGTGSSTSYSGGVGPDGRRKMRIGDMKEEVKRMRAQMEQDEQVSAYMKVLRGQNLNEDQWADDGVTMRLVEFETGKEGAADALPLVYDPDSISVYWGRRPLAVAQRMAQLLSVTGGFLSSVAGDFILKRSKEKEVQRARELREIVTSLGPAYIKLGQALSIRPDLLSPSAMVELQKLCDKVPSFDTNIAMALLEEELGVPPSEIFSELSPAPIAAASLGQVYKGKLRSTGETVAVKVQRPYVLETVTIDLFIIRKLGVALRGIPQIATDVVGLVDEWAARFFEELDYVNEGRNATLFAESMAVDLPQVVVPRTYEEYTSRRVLVTQWIDGEKLSQSTASDVGALVNVGVICYLKQLLDTGLFHADPHPGNLIRTPDGRLCVLDFGLMTRITEDQKYGMIEAISHLIHRDYEAITEDFVLLDFIPEGVNLAPILPVLARVFDQALEGGGAKGINFQELAGDLAQITFEYPFRIPPYFALIIRAIGVLEGIALVGDPDFAIVDAAYPYISKRLLTDPSPRLRAALRYTIYGRSGVFDADRFIDVMDAFETFATNSTAGSGNMYLPPAGSTTQGTGSASSSSSSKSSNGSSSTALGFPLPLPPPPFLFPFPPLPIPAESPLGLLLPGAFSPFPAPPSAPSHQEAVRTRAALTFLVSPDGRFIRDLILDEIVRALDAFGREQAAEAARQAWPRGVPVPEGLAQSFEAFVPRLSEEDEAVLYNTRRVVQFLGGMGNPNEEGRSGASTLAQEQLSALLSPEIVPLLPTLAADLGPDVLSRLSSRVAARFLREAFLSE